ncbi:MAG TPA: hypothetical protein VFG39_05220 [Balneolaceae bacterium]|nr:hypothetical protein [Balneolaceae bacterium]
MKRKLKEILPKVIIGLFAAFILFLIGVGIYTPFSENSYAYNLGYSLGYIIEPIAYATGYVVGYIETCIF